MRKIAPLVLTLLLHAGVLWSQDLSTYEKILLPVVVSSPYGTPLPGAHGSLWQTVVSITNRSDEMVGVLNADFGCRTGNCHSSFGLSPRSTAVPPYVGGGGANPSAFLFVDQAEAVVVNLRVQDVSRQSETSGSTVPVVRVEDLFTGRIDLLDIPSSDQFRSMLRVYDFDGLQGRAARIRILAYSGHLGVEDTVVFDEQLPFITSNAGGGWETGFIQLPLPHFETLPEGTRLRIEVTPVSEGLRFWAFVSVTHNETQHLTVIAPAN